MDMQNGRVVKGVRFMGVKDAGDPVEAAKYYSEAGADELVMLDIDASVEDRPIMSDVVAKIAGQITIPLIVGGGISTADQISELLRLGASKVSINTPAIRTPEFINEISSLFGRERVIVAIDVKKMNAWRWEVYMGGGRIPSGREAVEWALEVEQRGAGEILLTSMDSDGVREGYDIEITRKVADAVKIPVIASGGAGSLKDFSDAIIEGHADAVLAASLFHFRHHEIKHVKEHLRKMGVSVNL